MAERTGVIRMTGRYKHILDKMRRVSKKETLCDESSYAPSSESERKESSSREHTPAGPMSLRAQEGLRYDIETGVPIVEIDIDDNELLETQHSDVPQGLEGADAVERAKELANTAVECKTDDINRAVLLMEEAVKYHATDKYLARLAYYYHLAGKAEPCLATHQRRVELLDKTDPLSFHIGKANILDDIRKFYFREGMYTEALKYQCDSEWHNQIGLACQGKLSEDMLKNWKPLEGKNVRKAFKALDNSEKLPDFKDTFRTIYDSNLDILNQLSSLSRSFDFADDNLRRESLSRSEAFQGVYNQILEEEFAEIYEEKLAPLLEK